jgi:parvulin-like peptidyl-prolyl isomerase
MTGHIIRRKAVLTVAASVLAAATAAAGQRVLVEGILVRVNDRILTMGDFEKRLQVELSQLPSPPQGEALRSFAQRLFDQTVDDMILLERADEKHFTIDDEMVDKQIAQLREDNNLQDDDAFQQALKSAGLTVDALRDRYRQSMLMSRAAQSEVTATEITEEEVRQRYEADKEKYRVPAKVELEQVFFPVAADGSDREQVLRRARGLVERARAGNDLRAEATLAGVELQELGGIPVEDLRPDLAAALKDLPEGGLTAPIETAGGVQVVRLVRRIPASYQPFEDVKGAIRREMAMASYQAQTRGAVDRLRKEYLVEVHEDRFKQLLDQLFGAA